MEVNTIDAILQFTEAPSNFESVAVSADSKLDTFNPTVNAISELASKHMGRTLMESERIMLKIVLVKDLPTTQEQQTLKALYMALIKRQRRKRTRTDLTFLIDVISNYI